MFNLDSFCVNNHNVTLNHDSFCSPSIKSIFCWILGIFLPCRNSQQNYNPLKILNTIFFGARILQRDVTSTSSSIDPLAIQLESTSILAIEIDYVVLDLIVAKRDIELSKKKKKHMNLTCIFRIHGQCSFHGQNLCLGLMARLFRFGAKYAPKLGGEIS
jgi:hypothetical protein